MSTSQATEKKSRGLGRFLGKRDKTPERPTTLPDSAYASEAPSANTQNTMNTDINRNSNYGSIPDMIPAEKNSEIANIDKDKNLALKPSTGEVFDQDSGQVVTVVTTTTTTTTTTATRPGEKPRVHKDVQEHEQRIDQPVFAAADRPSSTAPTSEPVTRPGLSEMPAERSYSGKPSGQDSPPVPVRSSMRDNRQSEIPYETPISPIDGANEPPVSPNRHNFSYPSRSGVGGTGATISGPADVPSLTTSDRPQQHSKSTIADLRAAAKGIHGVGETLRGTLNSTIDSRFPNKNAEKQAAINAKHESVLNRGRTEMEGIPSHYGRQQSAIQTQPNDSASADQYLGATAEHDERERQKASSIGKLFKRKPVPAEGGDGLRGKSPSRRHY